MKSAIYEGRVRHARRRPIEHAFEYSHVLFYLDLDELPALFRGRWLWSNERPNLASFRRADHWGDAGRPLADSIRELVRERTGASPRGPIRLLTQLRHLGWVFNPVSFYYCFDEADRRLEAIVAEITNTPWGEQQCYVLPVDGDPARPLRWRFQKTFHVSPFLGMDVVYEWSATLPGRDLSLRMRDIEAGERVLDVTMRMRRREIRAGSLARTLVRHPAMSFGTISAIYWQALRLKLKGAPFFEHPKWRAGEPGPGAIPPR